MDHARGPLGHSDPDAWEAHYDDEVEPPERLVLARSDLPLAALDRSPRGRMIAFLLHRDGDTCQLCGQVIRSAELMDLDHIVPRSLGGSDGRDNRQMTHWRCNNAKGNKPEVDLRPVVFEDAGGLVWASRPGPVRVAS